MQQTALRCVIMRKGISIVLPNPTQTALLLSFCWVHWQPG